MENKQIIEKLLSLINDYDNNDIAKDLILGISSNFDGTIKVTRLSTKGSANEGTPFYHGNINTIIIEECWHNNEVINARIIAENKNYFSQEK